MRMAGVMLGMPGPWADNNNEAADMYTTKIGGLPDFPFRMDCLNSDLLQCNVCSSKLCLLAQVYAPISSKDMMVDDRVIYVFGCLASDCESQLWRAIRVQRISTDGAVHEAPEAISLSDNDKNTDKPVSHVNDSDDHEETKDLDLDQLMSAFSEAASITCDTEQKKRKTKTSKKPRPQQPARFVDSGTSVLPCFYIYTQEERDHKKIASENSSLSTSAIELDVNSGNSQDEESYEQEMYEYDSALHADRTYLKFKKQIDAYPEQCIRCSYNGKPLLASCEKVDPGHCNLCGEPRHYEMQLMPPVIYFLREGADDRLHTSVEKHDWMTLLVFTCHCSDGNGSALVTIGGAQWIVAEEAVIAQNE